MDLIRSSNIGSIANLAEDLSLRLNEAGITSQTYDLDRMTGSHSYSRPLALIMHAKQDLRTGSTTFRFFEDLVIRGPHIRMVFLFGCGCPEYPSIRRITGQAEKILAGVLRIPVLVGVGDTTDDFGLYSGFDPWVEEVLKKARSLCRDDIDNIPPLDEGLRTIHYSNIARPISSLKRGFLMSYTPTGDKEPNYLLRLALQESYGSGDNIVILPRDKWLHRIVRLLPFTDSTKRRLYGLSDLIYAECGGYDELLDLLNTALEKRDIVRCRIERGVDVFSEPSRLWLRGLSNVVASPAHYSRLQEMTANNSNSLRLYYDYIVFRNRNRVNVLEDFMLHEDIDDEVAWNVLSYFIDSTPVLQPRSYSIANSPLKKFEAQRILDRLTSPLIDLYGQAGHIAEIFFQSVPHTSTEQQDLAVYSRFWLDMIGDSTVDRGFRYLIATGTSTAASLTPNTYHYLCGSGTDVGVLRGLIQHQFLSTGKKSTYVIFYSSQQNNRLIRDIERYCEYYVIGHSSQMRNQYEARIKSPEGTCRLNLVGEPCISVLMEMFSSQFARLSTPFSCICICGGIALVPDNRDCMLRLAGDSNQRKLSVHLWDV